MKIIDLLNKIANGEEVPKKIRVHYRVFEKHLNPNAYLNIEDEDYYKYLTDLPKLYDDDRDWLNEEIEIIEENNKVTEACVNLWEAIKEPMLKVAKLVEDNKKLKLQLENIVEKKDKKIEKIGIINYSENPTEAILHKKIDEIIDVINEGKDE